MKRYGKIIIIVVGIIAVIALLLLIYFKVTFISKKEVKDIVVDDMNVSSNDVYFESIDLELDKNYYEVELYYQNNDYEYKVDAKNGKVIYNDFTNTLNNGLGNSNGNSNPNSNGNSSNNNSNGNNGVNNNANNAKISLQEARNIALTHANLDISVVNMVKCESEYDNGVLVYEIDFTYNNYEYDYKVDANTGEIISYDKDNIYD